MGSSDFAVSERSVAQIVKALSEVSSDVESFSRPRCDMHGE